MKIKVKQSVTGIKGNQPFIAFSVSGKEYDRISKYHGKDLDGYVVDIYKPKRSDNANAYMWVLIEQIAERSGQPRGDVYRKAIREAGAYQDIELDNEAVNQFAKIWGSNGVGWFTEEIISNNKKTVLRAYYGSSAYNSKQMSRLIDYVVDEAKFWDIETMTPEELMRLKGMKE